MLKRSLVVACLATASVALAEPQRALLTHENKFPNLHQFEVGGLYNYAEFENGDANEFGPYVRYGLLENLTANAFIPFRGVHPDNSDDEAGIGDIKLGLELKAWEDIFEYPYVIPHVDVALSTGDEDDGLGSGETVTTIGVSVGTVTFDQLHWVADVSYAINGSSSELDPDNNSENIFIVGGSIIWDVSDRFAVLAEGNFTDQDNEQDNVPTKYQGGFTYDWTESLMTGFYVGLAGGDNNADGIFSAKLAYTF